nr:TadE family protein [uncultured Blautia sp.]
MREKCNIEKDICQTTNRTVNKGSLTVETACVMPLILFTLLGLIYLSFFVHNRAWLTAAAYESAVSGSMEGVRKNGQVYDTARMRSEELGNTGFFGAENLSTQTNVGKQVQVTYDLDTISSYGNLNWHLRTEGTSGIINPVKHIRKIRAASAILKEMGD